MVDNRHILYPRGANKAMKYDANEGTLYTDDGRLIKELNCPLDKAWENLKKIDPNDMIRRCDYCRKNVLDISSLSDDAALELIEKDPYTCIFISSDAKNINWIPVSFSPSSRPPFEIDHSDYSLKPLCYKRLTSDGKEYREIHTARTLKEMNTAFKNGYKIVAKKIKVDEEFEYHSFGEDSPHMMKLDSYPPIKESFFTAAYLVPADIQIGETVYLTDLIENFVAKQYNHAYGSGLSRLSSWFATWNGSDFDVKPYDIRQCIG